MTPASQKVGLLALIFGACAVPCVAVATFIQSMLHPSGAEVLMFLDRLGLVVHPGPGEAPKFEPADFMVLNDYTATALLLWAGTYLAMCAIGIAVWADARDEDNLYPASGLACANMTIVMVNPWIGLGAMVVTCATVLAIRHSKTLRARDALKAVAQ